MCRRPQPSYDHYNRRGDVVAQTDSLGTLVYQAAYEAWGTRPAEFGQDTDRQRANTKEEDPTGLLDEGQRYRDLAMGVFLTRDPAGMVDGPNLYTYVKQNPWTMFDPEGLEGNFLAHSVAMTGAPPGLEQAATHLGLTPYVINNPGVFEMRSGDKGGAFGWGDKPGVRDLQKGDMYVYAGHGTDSGSNIAAAGPAPKGYVQTTIDAPLSTTVTKYPVDTMLKDMQNSGQAPSMFVMSNCGNSAQMQAELNEIGVNVAVAGGQNSENHSNVATSRGFIRDFMGTLAAGKTIDQALAEGNKIVAGSNQSGLGAADNYAPYTASYPAGQNYGGMTFKQMQAESKKFDQTKKPAAKQPETNKSTQ